MHLWGIDLGGTKMEGAILESRKNPQVLHRVRIPMAGGVDSLNVAAAGAVAAYALRVPARR